jgi:hypothetical protein
VRSVLAVLSDRPAATRGPGTFLNSERRRDIQRRAVRRLSFPTERRDYRYAVAANVLIFGNRFVRGSGGIPWRRTIPRMRPVGPAGAVDALSGDAAAGISLACCAPHPQSMTARSAAAELNLKLLHRFLTYEESCPVCTDRE